ncbi:MAG: DUF2244 domain-containing protein [Gammaproteobacteria bacterium]
MHLFELSPNCSLTLRTALVFYFGIVAVSLTIAVSFAIVGYWPILPFAGLELLALGAALRWSMLQGQRRERIRVDEDCVHVSKTGRGDTREYEFSRAWTQVKLVKAKQSTWPHRLLLTSKGKAVEVGRFLTEDERESLGRRLTEVIPGNPDRLAKDF